MLWRCGDKGAWDKGRGSLRDLGRGLGLVSLVVQLFVPCTPSRVYTGVHCVLMLFVEGSGWSVLLPLQSPEIATHSACVGVGSPREIGTR